MFYHQIFILEQNLRFFATEGWSYTVSLSITTIVLFIKEVDLTYIARVTEVFSGAGLIEICQRISTT